MKKSRLIGDKAVRILCWIIAVGVAFGIFTDIRICGAIIKGDILVNYVSETKEVTEGLLNGRDHQAWIKLPEQVEITGEADWHCRAAVTAMGINRYIFVMACNIMLLMVLINGTMSRLYTCQTVKLLLWSGLIPIIAFFVLPLINAILIPNIANVASQATLNVPDVKGITDGMPGGNGLIFILAANVLERACLNENEKKDKKKRKSREAELC